MNQIDTGVNTKKIYNATKGCQTDFNHVNNNVK